MCKSVNRARRCLLAAARIISQDGHVIMTAVIRHSNAQGKSSRSAGDQFGLITRKTSALSDLSLQENKH